MESKKDRQIVTHRAGWVIADAHTVIENGYVQFESGVIRAVGNGTPKHAGTRVDHGPGVLMPALVNVHTHLELSALHNQIDFRHGFRDWVRQLITARDRTNPETLLDKAHNALQGMRSTGTGMAGEISTTGLTRKLFSASKLAGIWFHEKLGSHTEESLANRLTPSPAPARQQYSLAGHAPHTTSPQLLVRLKDITRARQLPFSIHLAESCDESEFIETGKGAWANFLMERGIDFSSWGLPAGSPVQYLARLGLLDPQTIAVHLIRADHKDMDILRQSGTRIGLCLRSNQNLHARLPDVGLMFQKGLRPCLGTDSLASTNSLNMFDEMAFVTAHFPELGPGRIFSMATVNGAQALGFEHLSGTLAPGKFGPMMYLPLTDGTTSTLLEKIVHADFTGECVFVQDID